MRRGAIWFAFTSLLVLSCSDKVTTPGETPPAWHPGISFRVSQPKEITVGKECDLEILAIVDNNRDYPTCASAYDSVPAQLDTTEMHYLRVFWTQLLYTGPGGHISDRADSGFCLVGGIREDTFYVNRGDTVRLYSRLRARRVGDGYITAEAHFVDDGFMCIQVVHGEKVAEPKGTWFVTRRTVIQY